MSRRRRSLTPGESWATNWLENAMCWICNLVRPDEPLEIDHPHSWANGGETTYENSRVAHRDCNRKKGRQTFLNDRTKPA